MTEPQPGHDHEDTGRPVAPAQSTQRVYHVLEDILAFVSNHALAEDADLYLYYRRALYANLAANAEIQNLLHRVRTGGVAIESLEVMARLYYGWSSHYSDGEPVFPEWSIGDFAKIITADYDFMLRHLMKQWQLEGNEAKKQLEAQIETTAMASAAAVEIAALTSVPDHVAAYDQTMLYAFAWSQHAIALGLSRVEGFVFTDSFRRLMMSEARAVADLVNQAVKDHPGVQAAIAAGHYGHYRLSQFGEKAERLKRGEYVEGVTDERDEEEEKKRRDLNEELGQTIQALAAEKEIGGQLCEEKNNLVLEAGQTIADFLKGLAISAAEAQEQGLDANSNPAGGSENGEEQEKESSVENLLDQSFIVYVNQRKQELKVMQIVNAIQLGRQVQFTNKQDMKRFNEATGSKYSSSVTALTPEQLKAMANKQPPHSKLLEAEFDDMLRHRREHMKGRFTDLNHNGIPDHLEGRFKAEQIEVEMEITEQHQHLQQQMQRQQHKEAKQTRSTERKAQQSSRKSWDVNNDGIPDHLQQGVSKSSGPKPKRSDPSTTRTPEQREEHRETRQQRREERRTHREEQRGHEGEHKAPKQEKSSSKSGGKMKLSDVIGEVKMGSHLQVKSNAMTTNPTPLPTDKQVQR